MKGIFIINKNSVERSKMSFRPGSPTDFPGGGGAENKTESFLKSERKGYLV